MSDTRLEVIILGAGGHGRVVADILSMDPGCDVAGFTELDSTKRETLVMGYPVLGGDEYIDEVPSGGRTGLILGLGDIRKRTKLLERLERPGVEWVNAIHPSTCISRQAKLGKGIVMVAGSIVNCMAEIGDHCIINTNSSVGHDCVLGGNVHVASGCALGGWVRVGDNSMLGLGCRVIPRFRIGEGSQVAAGAVVVSDVPPGSLVMGVPARVSGKAFEDIARAAD